jgi:hypothetical protein
MGSITSANAVLTLSQPILFPAPQRIQGFSADDIYDMASVRTVETSLGVDGVLSGGFVFAERIQTITLQADSLSNSFFDTIIAQQEGTLTVFEIDGVIILPAISTKFSMVNGFLTGYTPAPAAKKTLQPRRYEITWNRVFPAATG